MILPRPIYILVRFAEMAISANSRVVNALFFGGSTHQTVSARAFIEGHDSPKWAKRRNIIDGLFWFQPNHCASAWSEEVNAARKTLEKAGVVL